MARPKSENPTVQVGVSLPASEWEYLRRWHPGNESAQVRELLERASKLWPQGPCSAGGVRSGGVRPGGKIELRRRVRQLEAALRAAGIDPEGIA